MKKTTIIIIIVLIAGILLIIGSLFAMGFNFSKLSNEKYEEKNEEFELEKDDTISIDLTTESLTVGVSDDGNAHIRYFDSEKRPHISEHKNGRYSFSSNDANRKWYEFINFDFSFIERDVELLLPENFAGEIDVTTSTGDVLLNDLELDGGVSVNSSTGKTVVRNLSAISITAEHSTGDLNLENVAVKKSMNVKSTTGDVKIIGAEADVFDTRTSTGSITLESLKANEVTARASTGRIDMKMLDAEKIALRTSTGDIRGTIKNEEKEYSVTSRTSTGSNNLRDSERDSKGVLEVQSSTGDINILFGE